jgi:hypothetical protein
MGGAAVKIRSRKFNGRCGKHKSYNPAIDGPGGIRGGCPRCQLLHEIWETSLRLNQLIRRFDPSHDDLQRVRDRGVEDDPRQMSLMEAGLSESGAE